MDDGTRILPARLSAALGPLAAVVALVVGGATAPGCVGRCSFDSDCGGGSYCNQDIGRCATQCFANIDCREPPGCETSETGCEPVGRVCRDGRCHGNPYRAGGGDLLVGEEEDGFDDAVFTGPVFVVDTLAIDPDGRGFALPGNPRPGPDNALTTVADFSNGPIASGMRSGVTLLLLEIAGLVDGYRDQDEAVTLKVYVARDADGDARNNFRRGPDGSDCCRFVVDPVSLDGGRQAVTRARARIRQGVLQSVEPFEVDLELELGLNQPSRVLIRQAMLRVEVPEALDRLETGLLGGAVPMNTLSQIPNPYCAMGGVGCPPTVSPNARLLDLVSQLIGGSDVDLDDDGLECVHDGNGDGDFDLCCEGTNPVGVCARDGACEVSTIESADPTMPAACMLRPTMADGYSVGVNLTGVRAVIE